LTVVDPVKDSDDVAAVPPSLDPDKRARLEAAGWIFGSAEDFLHLTAEEAKVVQHLMDLAKERAKAREPKAVLSGDPLADLEEELACHFGMRKDCPSCDD
jgi:hypothetical protein